MFAVLIFYVLTIAGIFVLRKKRPDAERPYQAFGYPIVPLLVHRGGVGDHVRAAAVQNADGVAGLGDCAAGSAGVLAVVAERTRKAET